MSLNIRPIVSIESHKAAIAPTMRYSLSLSLSGPREFAVRATTTSLIEAMTPLQAMKTPTVFANSGFIPGVPAADST